MTDTNPTQPRALAPRRLDHQESLQSLNQWKAVFRNYYRRCHYYGYFMLPNVTWNTGPNRGFNTPEPTGLKRDPATLAADLEGFLECIGSFLPFDYVGEKLKAESSSIKSVWDILYELYDVELSTTNFMDYALMKREPEETYRSFYNRLVGFMRQHLPTEAVSVEGISAPTTGENLTVALLDSIAIHWLLSIDPRLVGIVKTEYATELKSLRLSQMVKTISKSIDELLARYGVKEQIAAVTHSSLQPRSPDNESLGPKDISALIQRVQKLELNAQKFPRKQNAWSKRQNQCSHCAFINKELNSNLRTDHSAGSCPKRNVSISLLESMGSTADPINDQNSLSEYEGDLNINTQLHTTSLQTDFIPDVPVQNSTSQTSVNALLDSLTCDPSYKFNGAINSTQLVVSDTKPNHQLLDSYASHVNENKSPEQDSSQTGKNEACDTIDNFAVLASLPAPSQYPWAQIDKSDSPRIKCQWHTAVFSALIDSGAEVNALDRDFVSSLKIGITKSKESACAANKLPLDICGQTTEPVIIKCFTDSGHIMLNLGIVLVIANLGACCLLGEPAKQRNNIVCLPKHKIIVISNGGEVHYAP